MPVCKNSDTGIIILAAGSSSRLGTAKQLLLFQNKTLLQHTIETALAVDVCSVVVVTGASHDAISARICNFPVTNIYNKQWKEGMAKSMQAGLSVLLTKHPQLHSVIIMLCDQPYVSTRLLQELCEAKERTGKGIIASVYENTAGVPALFDKKYFATLLNLTGAEGAKKVILQHGDDVATIPFPLGAADIDTMADYDKLLAEEK